VWRFLQFKIKVKGGGQECPLFASPSDSRFLIGLGARFGMTGFWDGRVVYEKNSGGSSGCSDFVTKIKVVNRE
jgi:hypothetical protein